MSISSDVNQIHKTLFINSTATNEFEDIEDEKDEDILTTTKDVITEEAEIEGDESGGNVLTSDEGLSLIQASKDYIDDVQSITMNPWDYNSWQVYLEEVEQGRGGATSIEEAYIKFLERYPLSAKIYKRLADYYYHTKNDNKQAEAIYSKCLNSCRSVTLYYDYLIMLKTTTLDRHFSHKKDSIGATSKSGGTSSSMLNDESQYNAARNVFETAIEKSIEHVGMAIDANSVWRVYIDFIKEYPEIGTSDPGRKLQNLRKIYQRTVCIPMMELESFWKEYEVLEKSAGEHLAERVLPEYREKYNHAHAIFKEREKLTSSIVFERLAIPPAVPPLTLTQQQTLTSTTGTTTTITASNPGTIMSAAAITANNNMFAFESNQLDIWTKWIKYELSNPDQLPLEGLKNMMTYIYKKCVCCFRYHAEVWLNYSGFIYSIDTMIHEKNMKTAAAAAQSATGDIPAVSGSTAAAEMRASQTAVAVESRTILVQGIDVLPEVATLRVALAELEEKRHFINILNNNITLISASNSESSGTNSDTNNNTTTTMNLLMARQILREAFELLPSAYTFTVYQRYLRRHEGITSARRLFSETSPLRLEKKLGCEIYLAHAQLECEVNCQPAVASRVLALAMNDDLASISNIYFIRYYIKVLLLLGDIQQIRWVSFTALGRDPLNFTAVTAGTGMSGSSGSGSIDSATVIQSNLEQAAKDENSLFASPLKNAPPLHRYLVWHDLYHAETTLCQCNVVKLDMIKKCMQEAKRIMEDTSMSHASTQRTSGSSGDKGTSTTSVLSSFSNLIDSTKNIFEKYPVLTVTETTPDMLLKTRMQYYNGGGGVGDGLFDSSCGAIDEYDMQRQQQQLMSGSASSNSVSRRSQYQQQQSSSRGMRQPHDRDRDRGDRERGGDRDQQQQRSGQMDRDNNSAAISASASSSASGVSFEALTQILSFIPITAPSVVPADSTTATTSSTPVSQLMRDFLSRLPVYSGPALQVQELDQFVYHFRNLILPPRPLVPTASSAMSGMSDDSFFMTDGTGGGSSGGMMGTGGGYNADALRERESVGYGGGGGSNGTGVDADDYYDEYVSPSAATPYQQQQQKYSMEDSMQQGKEDDGNNNNNNNVNVFRQRRKDIKRRRE